MKYIDVHTHKANHQPDVIAILNFRAGVPVSEELVSERASFGIHPWDSEVILFSEVKDEINRFKHLFAIGECGLDKNISVPFKIQKQGFVNQIELCEAIQKPLIIHCVGMFNEIMDLKRSIKPSQTWIIHGFAGHPQLASQLIKENFILSFGKSIFKMGSKVVDSFKMLPAGSFFLETDESQKTIQEVYAQASILRNEEINSLKSLLYNQFRTLFKQKDGVD